MVGQPETGFEEISVNGVGTRADVLEEDFWTALTRTGPYLQSRPSSAQNLHFLLLTLKKPLLRHPRRFHFVHVSLAYTSSK
jgi:hypothetical protein